MVLLEKDVSGTKTKSARTSQNIDNLSAQARAGLEADKIIQNAEELFREGQFEQAMIKFSQGLVVRPREEAFFAGIKKCQFAIRKDLNGTGDAPNHRPKIPTTERSYFGAEAKSVTLQKAMKQANKVYTGSDDVEVKQASIELGSKPAVYNLTVQDGDTFKTIAATARDVKEYLKDRDYFLMKEKTAKEWKNLRKAMNKKVAEKQAVERFEKEAKEWEEAASTKRHCDEQVQLIERHIQNGKHSDAIRSAENFVKYLYKKPDKTLPRKWLYFALTFNHLGKACAEIGDFSKAKEFGKKLHKIAVSSKMRDLLVQSYILSGRVYAKFAKFEEAAFVWQKLVPLIDDEVTKAWLFHEIGRCYFELNKLEDSRTFGLQSVSSASVCGDASWSCTANVLLGQVDVKQKKFEEALRWFAEAAKYAEAAKDEAKLRYVESVINICKKALRSASVDFTCGSDGIIKIK